MELTGSNITTLGPGSRFMFSIFDKLGEEAKVTTLMARLLAERGVEIVSSGGTYKHLDEAGIAVTDCAKFTKIKPVLDHRVATLCPELHGGFLAEAAHLEELGKLGWPLFAGVVCTFYDLEKALKQKAATYESVNRAVDIGGPTMVRSACKGGRSVITGLEEMQDMVRILRTEPAGPVNISQSQIRHWQLAASQKVLDYLLLEVSFRKRALFV